VTGNLVDMALLQLAVSNSPLVRGLVKLTTALMKKSRSKRAFWFVIKKLIVTSKHYYKPSEYYQAGSYCHRFYNKTFNFIINFHFLKFTFSKWLNLCACACITICSKRSLMNVSEIIRVVAFDCHNQCAGICVVRAFLNAV
jgi:hypothetical protein